MKDAKDIIVLSIGAGIALAVIVNADKVEPLLTGFRQTWLGLIRTVSGTDKQQVR